jgi:hypothetical protein
MKLKLKSFILNPLACHPFNIGKLYDCCFKNVIMHVFQYFFSFFKYLNQCRRLKEKFEKAEKFYNLRINRIIFDNWRVYTQEFHLKVVQANKNYDIKMMDVKLQYFQEWREFIEVSKDDRYKEKVSDAFYLRNSLLKVCLNKYSRNSSVGRALD